MLNGAEIKHVKETKSLGIIVDEGLNWNEQYKKLKGKVSGGLWSLKKLMKIVPQSQLVNIYHALVESHLRYANVVWGSLSNTELEALQRLQNRAHSIIERAKIKDQWSGDCLTVEQLINFDRSVMTYKMMNKICPESFSFGIHTKQEICTQVIEQETARTFNVRDTILSTQRKAFTIRV